MTSAVTIHTSTARIVAVFAALLMLAALATPASAAHNGNNRADLAGDGGVTGRAVVNYSEGQGTFNGTATVQGLEAGMYTFTVNGPAGVQEICSFIVGLNGAGGCSAQDLALGGFGTAQIRDDANGDVVASGTFDRAGNCRDPQQGGTQCEANDTRQNG